MARYVVEIPVTVTAGANPYLAPARVLLKGQVLELSAAEVTAIGAGNLRAVAATVTAGTMPAAAVTRDQLGEAFAASNATP